MLTSESALLRNKALLADFMPNRIGSVGANQAKTG
jgi:hypothetical protein